MNTWKLIKVEKETESNCWHCGAAIKYVCWIENEETLEVIAVGRQCCVNFLSKKDCKLADCYVDYCKRYLQLKKRAEKFQWDEKTFAHQLRMYTTFDYVKMNHPHLVEYL